MQTDWSRILTQFVNSNHYTNSTFISKVGDHSRGWPEGSLFDSLLHQSVGEGATPFPGLLHFTLDLYLIMLSVKQGGIKYHFLSLWYDSTWDWTQVSRAIGEHSVFLEILMVLAHFTFYLWRGKKFLYLRK